MSDTAPEVLGTAQAFIYDGQVSEEKLGELLALGGEHSYLDFKREMDLKDPVKKLDFVKDCAAMMNQPQGDAAVLHRVHGSWQHKLNLFARIGNDR